MAASSFLTSTRAHAHASLSGRLPRVLIISNFLSPRYGSRPVQQDIRERLERMEYETTAASPFRSGLIRGAHMVSAVLLRQRRYDVAIVDVYSGRAFRWAEAVSLALTALRRPFVFILHGGNLPRLATRQPERVARCLARASVVVAPSHYLQEQMSPYCRNIELIPNGLDLQRYRFRERTNLAPRLMWLRALHSIYNPEMAVRVLADLATDHPDAHLTLIGPDKQDGSQARVLALAESLGVLERVSLPGSINKAEVPEWLDRGDIFLNSTNADNTPVSVLEAMACGLPVASTDVGGLPYLLKDGHDALLTPRDDHKAMAAAVRRFLGDPEFAAKLARNSRAKVESLDWSAIMPLWTGLLDRVSMAGGGVPNSGA